jgi:HEAT repeat protein
MPAVAARMLLLVVASALALQGPAGSSLEGEVRALLEASAHEPAPSATRLSAQLAGLGAPAIPALFTALALGPGRAPSELEEQALLEALARLPVASLRAHFRARLANGPVTDERRALLEVLARVGTRADLDLARLAAKAGLESASLADALESLASHVLGNEPQALEVVRRWIPELPAELAAALVRAVAASECDGALPALCELLGSRLELDRVLLPEIGGLAARSQKPLDGACVSAVVACLVNTDPVVLREACLAAGRMDDSRPVGRLVELLVDPHAGVRGGSREALERLSGLRFGGQEARWGAWHKAELAWERNRTPELRTLLRAPSAELVVSALSEISAHRLRRHELSLAVAGVLEHPEPLARRLACVTLGQLGSSAGIAGLRGALDDEDEGVRLAARRALRILGVSSPEASEAPDV